MAKKFKFSLNAFLKLKEYNTNLAKLELGKVITLKNQRELLKSNKEIYLTQRSIDQKPISNVLLMQAEFHHKSYEKDEIKKLEKEIESITEIENIKRDELNKKMTEEKTIEKLKEKEFEKYKYELNLEESKTLDDIGIQVYLKNKNER